MGKTPSHRDPHRPDRSGPPRGGAQRARPGLPPGRAGHRAPDAQDGPTAPSKPPPLGDLPRHVVCRVLARQARLYPEMDLAALDRFVDAQGDRLSDLDRAFAYALYDLTVRYWLALSYLLGRCTSQPFGELEPRLQGVLLAAASQILLMDKVPNHAAINHAVEWAKVVIRPGAGKMANAVLRKFAALKPGDGGATDGPDAGTATPDARVRRDRYTDLLDELPGLDGSAIVLAQPVMPEDELDRLSLATSHPRELLAQWLKDGPMREVRRLAMHSMCRPPVILNTAHLASTLPDGPLTAPHTAPGHHVFVGTGAELQALLTTRPDLWVQDPASALAVQGVADLRPSLVLDLCAGHGTKTRQLARTFPSAKIVATDVDEHRFRSLQKAFAGDEQVAVLEPARLREKYAARADLVLLDVPCSNTGVLARRPEAKLRFSAETLASLTGVQRQIVADALPLLTEGGAGAGGAAPTARGRILYSTCSLEPKENAQQVAWADRWHKLGVSRERRHSPQGGPTEPPHIYCDGSFAALLG